MRTITIVFFDAGGGHRNAALALQDILQEQDPPWQVRLLNLQEKLDSLDFIRSLTGIRMQDVYNQILRRGWTRWTPQLLPLMHAAIRLHHGRITEMLREQWQQEPADLVLSVIPNFNRALAESVRKALPGTRFVTLLTDLADYPPHFWIEKESDFIICGTERARNQALMMGHSLDRIHLTSGMIVKRRFYSKPVLEPAEERRRIGLRPDLPTGIVLFGGQGSPVMSEIVTSLDRSQIPLQLILVCGSNEGLAATLKGSNMSIPMFVEGFTPDIDRYMSLCHFFIGKPGPGSISEALQMDLPVIVECNSQTMPQERYNTEWVTANRVGIVLQSFRDIASAVEELLQPEHFEKFRRNARAYNNRALFEVPDILNEIYQDRCTSNHSTEPWPRMRAGGGPRAGWMPRRAQA